MENKVFYVFGSGLLAVAFIKLAGLTSKMKVQIG